MSSGNCIDEVLLQVEEFGKDIWRRRQDLEKLQHGLDIFRVVAHHDIGEAGLLENFLEEVRF